MGGGSLVRPGVALPPSWAARGVALRPEEPADQPFLEALFVAVRADTPAFALWPEDGRRVFLASQFAFQARHYAMAYPQAERLIVTWQGQPAGRLFLAWGERAVRVVDIALVPQARGGGLGSALLEAVQAAAAERGLAVSLHVDPMNPAQALYRRLGFVVEEAGPEPRADLMMVWPGG